MPKEIVFPLQEHIHVEAGEMVLITGVIYTARDAAHKKLVEMLKSGEKPPFPFENELVYYAGPSPAPPKKIIGSVGPTTSGRMDAYSPFLIEHGLRFMLGKGGRSNDVEKATKKYGGVYFCTVGGAGALISNCVKSCEIVAFPELGTEAVRKLVVEKIPAIAVITSVCREDSEKAEN